MNVCILSKFPPLEGGISARTYWLARAYADAGISVQVVSNCNSAEKSYRIDNCLTHIQNIPGVTIHEVESEFPWHIPDEPHSLAKLVDKTLEVIDCHKIDVIDSSYLLPYGIAAFLVNRLTGIPYTVRHGGSDLAKFLKAGRLKHLLKHVLNNAAVIVTDPANEDTFAGVIPRKVVLSPYVPNPRYFCIQEHRERTTPTLLFMGKINWHWERKGLDRILRCVRLLPPNWNMQWIGQGKGEEKFREFAKTKVNLEPVLEPFIPPWDVPDRLQHANYIFCLSINDPISSYSNIVVEAVCCGATIVVDSGLDLGLYPLIQGGLKTRVLQVDSANPESMARALLEHWEQRKDIISDVLVFPEFYEGYRDANVAALSVAAACEKIL